MSTEGIINMLKFRDDGPHGVHVVGYEAQVGVYTEGIIMLKVRDDGLYGVHTVGYEAQVGVYRGYCVKAQRRWAIRVHAVGC